MRPRVGLVWSGGFRPEQPELWSTHERRNISLAQICTLNTRGVDFFSLQKGEPAESQVLAEIGRHWTGNNFFNYAADLSRLHRHCSAHCQPGPGDQRGHLNGASRSRHGETGLVTQSF